MAKLLDTGTELWTVEESISDRWFSGKPYHYEVVHGRIGRINHGGYNEYVVQSVNRLEQKSNLLYLKTSGLGKSFFLTEAEAVELAEEVTDDYERRWACLMGYPPLLRPWREGEKDS